MHRGYLVAVLLSTCQALAAADPLCAMDDNAASAASVDTPARERPAQAVPGYRAHPIEPIGFPSPR